MPENNQLPPRALLAANAILIRFPDVKWTPLQRDEAAALIARHTGESKALEACRALTAAYRRGARNDAHVDWSDIDDAEELARHALRTKPAGK